jgi:PAS domain S-box-containing protein
MPSTNSRSALRISLLFAFVLISADLLIDFIVLNLALSTETMMRLLVIMDIPLAIAYIAYLYIVLRREFNARGVVEGERLAADARLHDVVDLAPVPMIGSDEEFRTTLWNPAAERMYGWTRAEALGRPVSEVLGSGMSPEARAEAVVAVRAKGEFVSEYVHHRRDGTQLSVTGNTIILRDPAGKLTGYLSVNRDVTAERAMEQRLQASEARLRLIMDKLPAAISYLDRDQRYTFANAGYERLMGLPPSRIIGQKLADVMRNETYLTGFPRLQAALAGETQVFENELPKAGGGTFRAMVQFVPDWQGDEVVGVHVLLTDISQLRETQEALAREHQEAVARAEELQAVLEAAPVPIYVAENPECTVITGNRLAYEMLGAKPGSNMSGTAPDPSLRPPYTVEADDAKVDDEALPMQRVGRTGQAVRNYEFVLTLPDGTRRNMFGHAVPLLNSDGRTRGVIAAFSDVTALKLAGDELRRSREQFKRMAELAETRRIEWQLLFDNMTVGVALFDADGKALAVNPRYLSQHGLADATEMASIPDLPGQFEVSRADGSPVELKDWPLQRARNGEHAVDELVVRAHKSGTVMHARYTCAPIRDGDGRVVRVFETVEDVTDLRMAEAAARAHANELQTLLDAVPNAVFIARDPACEVITGSDLAYQLLRRPKGSNLSKTAPEEERPTTFRALYDGREIEPTDLPLQRAARTGEAARNCQFDLAFEDGEILSMIGNAAPLLDERGRPRGAIGAFADITALKRTESALRASEATVRQQLAEIESVYNTLPVGLAVVDAQLRYRRVNERLAEINGIPAREHLGKPVREVLPQFADVAEKVIAQIIETGEPARETVFSGATVADPDTEHTWVEHWVPFLGPDGRIDGVNIVVEDVTEQRRVQAELLESQELMRRALDVGRGFAFQYRMRSDKVVRSPESAKILGLPEGPNATGDTGPAYFQRVHPQDRSRYVARMLGLTPENDSYRTTYRIVRPDGRTIAVEESARGLFDDDGTLVQVFGITQDVTERVQAEQERERLLEQVQAQQARLAGLARDLQAERDIMAAIMENTRTQLAYIDPQFRFVKVNSAYAAGSGHTIQSLLGKDHFSLFPNEENQAIFEHVRETGQPVEYRARPFYFADQPERGTTYWDWTLVPVRNPDGAVRGMVFSLSDVTEQKRAEEVLRTARDELQQRVSEATAELRAVVVSLEAEIAEREHAESMLHESEARLRILVEQVPAVLWTTDRDLVYTSLEGAGLASIGVQPGQLVGSRVPGIPGTDNLAIEEVLAAHEGALAGEGVTFRARLGAAYFEGYIEPLREADGSIGGCIGVALDITARVRSEEVRREREQQYRNIFESTSDGMMIIDTDGQIVDANPAASKMSGYEYDEFLSLSPLTFIRSEQREPLERFFQSVRAGRRLERQATGVRKDGSEFDLEVRASQFQYAGEPHVLAVLRDITERVRSFQLLEQRVRERTRELSALLAFSRQATATLEVRPLMELVVEEASRLVESSGVSLLMLEGETLKIAAHRGPLPASTAEQVRLTINDPGLRSLLLTNPTPIVLSDVQMEGRQAEAVRRAGGAFLGHPDSLHSIMWIPLVVQQKLIGGIGIGHRERGKYTERDAGLVQAIASQAAVALENARLYEQAHELAVIHERQRLARELHDSVTQSLYSLSLMAEAARRLVAAGNKERGMAYLVRIGEAAQQVLKEMRLLVYELRPLMLERDGLASALKQRLETVEGRAGVETKLFVEGAGLLPENIETELYRIAQEALNNSLKHANASSVAVSLSTGGDPVSLTVQDNGRGFSAEEIEDKGGLGLVSMQERAQRLGGRVDVVSAPGEGATITVTIPLSGNPRK